MDSACQNVTIDREIEGLLERIFGSLAAETGAVLPFSGASKSDYLIGLGDEAEARRLAYEMRERGVASGVRAETGQHILRLSKNDLAEAMRAGSTTDREIRALLENEPQIERPVPAEA